MTLLEELLERQGRLIKDIDRAHDNQWRCPGHIMAELANVEEQIRKAKEDEPIDFDMDRVMWDSETNKPKRKGDDDD